MYDAILKLAFVLITVFSVEGTITMCLIILELPFVHFLAVWLVPGALAMFYAIFPLADELHTVFSVKSALTMCFIILPLAFVQLLAVWLVEGALAMKYAILPLAFVPAVISLLIDSEAIE
jgi:hypothetical protein